MYAQQDTFTDSLGGISQNQQQIKEESDEIKKTNLANAYIDTIKSTNDVIVLADAYHFLSESFTHSETAVAYADSIIQITKDVKDIKYPAEGYLQKGIQLYYIADHDGALENYLKANEYYSKQKNDFKQLVIKHYIGLLKNNINESGEAFLIFKKNMRFFEKTGNQENHKEQYLKSLYALSNAYILSNKPDSAIVWSKTGINASLKTEDHFLYPYFLFSSGSAEVLKKNYPQALDSLIKGSSLILSKKKSLCTTYLNISEVYDSLNNTSKSLQYLYKVDSIYKKEPQVIYKVRNAYEILLKKYQDDGNTDKQLEIIKKLLAVNNIIKKRPQNLSRKIVEHYDTPKLLYEKEKLIKELEKEKSLGTYTSVFLGLLSIGLVLGVIYFARKNVVNKNRFKALLANHQTSEKSADTIVDPEKGAVIKEIDIKDADEKTIDLPDDVVNTILTRLDRFEASKKFVQKQYTLSSLAKELNTNSAYLSKIINAKRKTSFAHYMNNLRIDYAVTKLKEDTKLRSYTIKAIANEFGFNTAQSFSNAFYKKTGIYPSFFLKQLHRHLNG